MNQFFPFFAWLKGYKKTYLVKDILAGLTVGVILVPQGMAYAMIAGLPPVHGLYAALFPVLIYALLGTSRKTAVGPVALDSLLVAVGLGTLAITSVEEYVKMVMVLALMVGAIQLLLSVFRMGFFVNFLSKPVISGFTSAAAIIIIVSQLKHLLGISLESNTSILDYVVSLLRKVHETNVFDFAFGSIGILLLMGLKKWNRNIPGILIIVLAGIAVVYFFQLESLGIKLVGAVPKGLPDFVMPVIQLQDMQQLWPIAIALALVGYLETISIGKALEDKSGEETIKPNQELLALGLANVVGGLFQGYITTGSFSRSAINYEAGAKTNLAGVFSVFLVVLTLLFLTPIFEYLPNAVLASIIMVSVFGLIDIPYAKRLWNNRKDEFAIVCITFLVTLGIGIAQGILVGVLCSLLLLVFRTSSPHFAEIGSIRNTDYYKNVKRFADEVEVRNDLLIVRFDAQLYFGNSGYFKRELYKLMNAKGSLLKGVILNAEAISYIDATAVDMLTKSIKEIHDRDIQFYLVGAIGPFRDIIFDSDIITELNKEYLFVQTKEAVDYFDHHYIPSSASSWVAYENKRVLKNS